MKLEETQVTLRKLVASEGKVIISKELNEEGEPLVISKEIYLGNVDSEENYEEVNEELYNNKNEKEVEEENGSI